MTNGAEFQLYDAITKEPITEGHSHFPDGTTITLPADQRMDALRLFFDLSPHNVALFAQAQVDSATKPLFGAPDDLAAVYIRETHIERAELSAAIHQFVKNSRPLFVLVGQSGMGKTCVMMDIARVLAGSGHPVMFFRGALIEHDVVDAVAAEVEWAFGAQRGSIDTLRRLSESAGAKPLVLMVDGLEDWRSDTRTQHLATLVSHIGRLNARLIVSCKTSSWETLTSAYGARTGIEHAIYGGTYERPISASIGPFSPKEFHAAVERHREVYGIHGGGFDPVAQKEARSSPFVLRLMFQVKAAAPQTGEPSVVMAHRGRMAFDSRAFFETYLRLAARRTGKEEVAVNTLIASARTLYELDREWVEEPDLRASRIYE